MTEPTEERPLVTFALFAYNQERFIREAVEGALAQTYSPLQVILSDDCSSDRTFEIMQEMVADYSGPHEILLNRNERNLGLAGHINRLMELVRSDLIVAAAGDDISEANRVSEIVKVWLSNKKICSIHSLATNIDENSQELDIYYNPWGHKLSDPFFIAANDMVGVGGCTQAWSKKTFNYFGKINDDVFNEDIIIPFRAALIGCIAYIENPLVKYRRSVGVTTEKNLSYRERIREVPCKLVKRSLANLNQLRVDANNYEWPRKDALLSLLEEKIQQQETKLEFLSGRGSLILMLKGLNQDLGFLFLLKIYIKNRLPESIIFLYYKIKGL